MLQMPVYREITTVEPKVMLGMGWRQLGASLLMLCLGIPAYLLAWLWCGIDPDAAILVVLPIVIPPAIYGWLRPRGMKPEKFLVYIVRHWTIPRTLLLDGAAKPCVTSVHPTLKEK